MTKPKSRKVRWDESIAAAQDICAELSQMRDTFVEKWTPLVESLETAFSNIEEVKHEYEEWRDNLPESLRSRLDEVASLDTDCPLSVDSLESMDGLEEAIEALEVLENADLPVGFGRD